VHNEPGRWEHRNGRLRQTSGGFLGGARFGVMGFAPFCAGQRRVVRRGHGVLQCRLGRYAPVSQPLFLDHLDLQAVAGLIQRPAAEPAGVLVENGLQVGLALQQAAQAANSRQPSCAIRSTVASRAAARCSSSPSDISEGRPLADAEARALRPNERGPP